MYRENQELLAVPDGPSLVVTGSRITQGEAAVNPMWAGDQQGFGLWELALLRLPFSVLSPPRGHPLWG